jgi:hypothetical protein
MAYIGPKGSVMVADKRSIAYSGKKENREELEEALYSGHLKTDEEFKKKAKQLNVIPNITEDNNKIKKLENTIVGEVRTIATTETKRRRIYTTTNAYKIIELIDANIISSESEKKGIVVFGNKLTKALASKYLTNEYINQIKKPDVSLRFIGDVFLKIFENIALQTPSIGKKYDVLIQQTKFNSQEGQAYLDNIIERNVKLLGKSRDKLKSNLAQINKKIQMEYKIIDEGDIGKVSKIENNIDMIQVTLNNNVQAFDSNWKSVAKPGTDVIMFITNKKAAKIGDEVVIENENLCLKRNKESLKCDIILAKA